ncbi:MAG: hypothetical protein AB7P02_18435 [Alphaproteobacteria bacterium]
MNTVILVFTIFSAIGTCITAWFTFTVWHAYRDIRWHTASMASNMQLDIRLKAKEQKIEVVWWDDTIEPYPRSSVHGQDATPTKIYVGIPRHLRASRPGWFRRHFGPDIPPM